MKKLMIAAAAAAMIGGAQAFTCFEMKDPCGEYVYSAATAHKVTISLKTTENKGETARATKCDEAECTYWRQQATKKINGLLWGYLADECPTCFDFADMNSAFWTKDGAIAAEFGIGVGMIGKKNSKKIEAYGVLAGDDFGALSWAGFGSVAVSTKKIECEDPECSGYVKSISGGIAGQLIPAEWDDLCTECEPIEYDVCCDDFAMLENTAAYGTIKISYDKSTAKKVATVGSLFGEDAVADIAAFYKLPAAAAATIEDAVAAVVVEE